MTRPGYAPFFELTRGQTVESCHFGAAAVVDAGGRLVARWGDPGATTFLRSTAKPFQALPFLEAGGAEAFQLQAAEIALICASHAGTDAHLEVVRGLQARLGLAESDLQCGTHTPYDKASAEALRARGEEPTPNHHNCSGKHTGMLAAACLGGWPLETYLADDHPLQVRILEAFAAMAGLPAEQVALGVDGCSAPNFAVPLHNAALAFARLCDPQNLPASRAAACRRVTASMLARPDMVAGPGRFDTRLMEVGDGRLVSKGGAEGYQGVGVFPGAQGTGSPALGVAFKISDGDPTGRARPAVTLEVLRQLGVLGEDDLTQLAEFGPEVPVKNWRGLEVGVARPCFQLERN